MAGLKRRLIFVPLPEPEPLHTEYRAILPSSGGPVGPLLHPEAPVGAGASVLSGVLHPLYHKLISYQDPFLTNINKILISSVVWIKIMYLPSNLMLRSSCNITWYTKNPLFYQEPLQEQGSLLLPEVWDFPPEIPCRGFCRTSCVNLRQEEPPFQPWMS